MFLSVQDSARRSEWGSASTTLHRHQLPCRPNPKTPTSSTLETCRDALRTSTAHSNIDHHGVPQVIVRADPLASFLSLRGRPSGFSTYYSSTSRPESPWSRIPASTETPTRGFASIDRCPRHPEPTSEVSLQDGKRATRPTEPRAVRRRRRRGPCPRLHCHCPSCRIPTTHNSELR